ncbi:MAG: hypothetical protein CVT98_07705 [Bacteroidetes bacterium HGW-Bacteroidetes-15]|nr:MAG: hypothetical protein CVT98_07705 [Bacteroidetes bacterium HGW-Bacteroidetes-15]
MLPNTKEFLHKKLLVGSSYIDLTGKLSVHSLFSFFQEVAWEHATLNGFGFEHLKEKGFFWALSRVYVEIEALPKWTEPITLSTWPSGTEGPFALRDFSLFNDAGEKIIGATSSWLIVDYETRRPRRPDAFKERMPICDTIRATKCNAQKISGTTHETIYSYQITSRISDIDVNGHINNTRYVEWAINSFPLEFYQEAAIKEITINFLSEGFCGDNLRVDSRKVDDRSYVSSIIRELDSKVLALVEIHI